jgi:two-component system chemotaxis response regulator CheB
LRLRHSGGRTFAQDRESCAVWGMPAAAEERKAAEAFVTLEKIPHSLLSALNQTSRTAA